MVVYMHVCICMYILAGAYLRPEAAVSGREQRVEEVEAVLGHAALRLLRDLCFGGV